MKAPVLVASTGNLTLSGEQTIDGIAVVSSDRVLVKDQTDATENAVYIVDTGAWSRAADFDGARDVVRGTIVYVSTGTAGGDRYFAVTSTGINIPDGSSNITFASAGRIASTAVTVSAYAETLLDDSSAVDVRATLGLEGAVVSSSTSLQQGALLLSDSTGQVSLASSTGGLPYFTGGAGSSIATIASSSTANVLYGGATAPFFAAAPAGVPQATQAALEAETNEDTYAPPDLLKHNPGIAKAWAVIDQIGTIAVKASHNLDGTTPVVDNGVGDFTLNWGTDFSSTNYAVAGMADDLDGTESMSVLLDDSVPPTASAARFLVKNNSAQVRDIDPVCIIAMGDQA